MPLRTWAVCRVWALIKHLRQHASRLLVACIYARIYCFACVVSLLFCVLLQCVTWYDVRAYFGALTSHQCHLPSGNFEQKCSECWSLHCASASLWRWAAERNAWAAPASASPSLPKTSIKCFVLQARWLRDQPWWTTTWMWCWPGVVHGDSPWEAVRSTTKSLPSPVWVTYCFV